MQDDNGGMECQLTLTLTLALLQCFFFTVCRRLYASYKTYHINKVFVVYKIENTDFYSLF